MQTILNRPSRVLQFAAALLPFFGCVASAPADIFQWEYINPADPSQGKRQSTTLAPDGAGVDAVPGADLSNRDLTMASLPGANFFSGHLSCGESGCDYLIAVANLSSTNLSRADLTGAYLAGATLTGANFTGADIRSASFDKAWGQLFHNSRFILRGTGITLPQLYSTESYQEHDLTGVRFYSNNLADGKFAGQNLTGSLFESANLIGADFTGAEIRGASFDLTGITVAQLHSTASYQRRDLTGVGLGGIDLHGEDFAGYNLTYAHFSGTTLTDANFHDANLTNAGFLQAKLSDADFTGAQVLGVNFSAYPNLGTGITLAQLYSTASYQAHDLRGIGLEYNNLAGANFAEKNLTAADFLAATLVEADFQRANLTNATFSAAILTDANLAGAQVVGANFGGDAISLAQLYSTASYQAHDLTGIGLGGNNLTGANFAGQNLTNATFSAANLTDANLADAQVVGAEFGGDAITLTQLYSTASYQAHDLTGIGLGGNNLTGANFAGQNLTNALLFGELTGADLNGAEVRGASFSRIALAQLYSTASYQAHDLSGIGLIQNDLAGGNFAGQNLTNARFSYAIATGGDFSQSNLHNARIDGANLTGANLRHANLTNVVFTGHVCHGPGRGCGTTYATLTDADLTAADARGADLDFDLADVIATNLIRPNGHIAGLELDADGLLAVRDYDGNPIDINGGPVPPIPIPITVDEHLAMQSGGTLQMVFEADAWDSTISFAPGIPVTLGGTLELTFAADVNLASQVGRTFDLFDWTGVSPTGAFAISSPYAWDLSNLYTTGEATLTSVPEPSALLLFACGLATTFGVRRKGLVRRSRVPQVAATAFSILAFATTAQADIFQWEYVDPADPSQGKRQSTQRVWDGLGVTAGPGANLVGRDLTMAYLIGADLSNAKLGSKIEVTGTVYVNPPLSSSPNPARLGRPYSGPVKTIDFRDTRLGDADFTGANVRGASFSRGFCPPDTLCNHYNAGGGITLEQLYSTASYQARNLSGINFTGNVLSGGKFAGQNLANTGFTVAYLTDADFTGADIKGATFDAILDGTGLKLEQLYSTATYQTHDLTGIGLSGNDLTDGNFAGFTLSSARFSGATLTDADFSSAIVQGASFDVYRYTIFGVTHEVGTGITLEQLYSTGSYRARNLSGVGLARGNFEGANFAGQNLANARFTTATLTGADFSGATICGASFAASEYQSGAYIRGTGITLQQLYSTASYQAKDLSSIDLTDNNLAGGNFAGQLLTNASLGSAILTGADFSGADARGAYIYPDLNSAGAVTTNFIQPNGHINGLDIDNNRLLIVRNYRDYFGNPAQFPITVEQHFAMGSRGALRMKFDADAWESTISFAPGIPLTLGGTLELSFDDGVNLASQVGRSFDLFNWDSVDPTSAFVVSSPYTWDLSNLYTTGEVTLIAVPEPSALCLLMFGLATLAVRGRATRRLPKYAMQIVAVIFSLVASTIAARADIFQWEYINPTDPSQGKQQSTMLAPDGAGAFASTNADLRGRNLTMAYLHDADLMNTFWYGATLTNADLSHANLTNAYFEAAWLTYADFSGAEVQGAYFVVTTYEGFMTGGLAASQLYSTASYQAHDLTGINLIGDMIGWNFAGQNLANATFYGATLTDAEFAGARIRGANLAVRTKWFDGTIYFGTGITPAQLYSTASYQAGDLSGINFSYNLLEGASFAGQRLTDAKFSGASLLGANFGHANLTNADFAEATLSGANLTGADVRGANFDNTGLTKAQLYSAASYQSHILTAIRLSANELSGWNFVGQNLANATFSGATLTNADLAGAQIQGASFGKSLRRAPLGGASVSTSLRFVEIEIGTGITLEQLYSTASYQAHELSGINLFLNDLVSGNFAGQDITNAYFARAILTGADFTAADARGASLILPATATDRNLIHPDGHIGGLLLDAGELLAVRDYDGEIAITVEQRLMIGPGATMSLVFEADAWDSTISFAPGIPVTLGGTLELTFADDVNLASQVGRTFDLFDWTGVNPTGAFAVSSPYRWNLSNLYTTGEVTLTAVPEVPCIALTAAGAFGLTFFRRRIR